MAILEGYLFSKGVELSANSIIYFMKYVHMVAWILLVVGGLNWGLTAFGWNVVDMLLGAGSTLAMIVYILVGLSAVYELFTHWGNCKQCAKGSSMPSPTM